MLLHAQLYGICYFFFEKKNVFENSSIVFLK